MLKKEFKKDRGPLNLWYRKHVWGLRHSLCVLTHHIDNAKTKRKSLGNFN